MKAKPHVAVIGAGAFGGWTALHLLELSHPNHPLLRRLRPLLPAAEIEELRGRRSGEPNQQRNRDRQRDQGAGLGKHPEKGSWLLHAARSQ